MAQVDTQKLLNLRKNIDEFLSKKMGNEAQKLETAKGVVMREAKRLESLKTENDRFLQQILGLVKSSSTESASGLSSTLRQISMAVERQALVFEKQASMSGRELAAMQSGLAEVARALKSQPKSSQSFDVDKLVKSLGGLYATSSEEIARSIGEELKSFQVKLPEMEFPKSISIDNFPPQRIPQPVTSININPLRGYVHSTAQTITATRSAVPSYGVLDNRRSLQFYNNDSAVTVYIGGSGVTASTGLPVPPTSYSPAFDAGPKMILYALTSSGSADIRVMEISNENVGG